MNLNELYIQAVNNILSVVDFKKLHHSCNSSDTEYAKDILKQLHQAFVDTYGTDILQKYAYEYVDLPAVIRGRDTKTVSLGLVLLDLTSSGEHWDTTFFTKFGVMEQCDEELPKSARKYLSDTYGKYDYWYTPEIPSDIHVCFENLPGRVRDLLSSCSGIVPNQVLEGIGSHAL